MSALVAKPEMSGMSEVSANVPDLSGKYTFCTEVALVFIYVLLVF